MGRFFTIFLFLFVLAQSDINYTISGLSSGGSMAGIYSIIFSDEVVGAGIIAGSPYGCNIWYDSFPACFFYIPSIPKLWNYTEARANAGLIAPLENVSNMKLYFYSGIVDVIVWQKEMKDTYQYYTKYQPTDSMIITKWDIASQHGVAVKYSDNCTLCDSCGRFTVHYSGLQKCDYDTAENMFTHFYGPLQPRVEKINFNQIVPLPQKQFLPANVTLKQSWFAPKALLYIPTSCNYNTKNCRLHIYFHGCGGGDKPKNIYFPQHSGYGNFAETNNIVILYPMIMTIFRNGDCWDWWGGTGKNFDTRNGIQAATVRSMANYILNTDDLGYGKTLENFDTNIDVDVMLESLVYEE